MTQVSYTSLKELLKDDLLTEEDQPYEIPEDWVWVKFGSVCRLFNGFAYKSSDFCDEGIPIIRISDLNGLSVSTENSVKVSEDHYAEKFAVKKGDLLIAMSGATTGKIGIYHSDQTALQNQRVGNIKIMDSKWIIPEYRNYFVIFSSTDILNKAYGGAQPNISGSMIEDLPFPLPSLAEQKRIVDRIESLFAKLDQAKELVQYAVETFESRNASILHKAFSAELTSRWREQHNVEIGSWIDKRFDEVADIKSNLVDPKEYLNFPHIAPDNIERRTGQLLEYRTIEEDGVISSKHRFYTGQILYSKIRPYLSKVTLVDFDGLCSADMYPIESKEDTKYLWYYMLSDEFLEQASSAGSRSVLPKINQKELSALRVPMPSLPEQKEIVKILDSMFEKEQMAKSFCDVIEKIDLIKKAILARAFRGELDTNAPTDESTI